MCAIVADGIAHISSLVLLASSSPAIYISNNLVDWSLHGYAFGVTQTPGVSLQLGDYYYCGNWAPDIRPDHSPRGGYILSFTSSRYHQLQKPCPPYDEGSGVFVAWSLLPWGPYNTVDTHPQPTGASADCPSIIHDNVPFSHLIDRQDCSPQACNNSMRLDSDLFNDPLTGEKWFSYSWYSNSLPVTPWDHHQLGEHVMMVRLNQSDPMLVPCDVQEATKVWIASPHDNRTLSSLSTYCPRCSESLSFTKGRQNETMQREGVVWGVTEASMTFRRGEYVYLLYSHSAWDSAYYSVAYVAAKSVEELSLTSSSSSSRFVGRFLLPSLDQSFGHGTAVLGPDNQHWYYIHHHLNHTACQGEGNCKRDIYISPLNFEDRGDGKGQVYIKPVLPAEALVVPVYQMGEDEQDQDQEGDELILVSEQ